LTKVERLERRLEHLSGAGKVWIPPWLSAVGSREEFAEWKAILQARRGQDQLERRLEFQRKMREKHPDMPLTFDEHLEKEAERLKNDPELARREGLDPVESYADERRGE
jgi:hypothetical protein